MDKRDYKNKVYTIMAELVKSLANPHRLEIIDLLSQTERPVEEIAVETGMSVANASQHLQVLKQSNLVQMRRAGNFIFYRLADDNVYRSWKDFRKIGLESIAEIDKVVKDYRNKKNSFEPVQLNELLSMIESNKVILIDFRPEKEYNAGHIPKALNIPLDQLSRRMAELKKSKQYIAYCRGPFCVLADEAVQRLTEHGFKIRRLDDGFPDWKVQGLPVEKVVES
ncbi:MAG: ArsR family transcriptional regulator [Bacteroidetes bacterium]|nr:MAG: ArsR family transcriptional regulator [Bacteroidota bacterium]